MAIRTCKHCAYGRVETQQCGATTANATQNPNTTRTVTAPSKSGLRKGK